MLNVIVSTGLRNAPQGEIWSGRIFQHTEESILALVMPDGEINEKILKSFPALFMEEGVNDQSAGLGWIEQVSIGARNTTFSFRIDPVFPRLTNSQVHEMAVDLNLSEYEFATNHWAVKDVNIYEVLYRRSLGAYPQPTVFNLTDAPVQRNLVSFMMPFDPAMNGVYHAVRATLEASGYQCQRADDFWVNHTIIQDIVHLIETSRVIVSDLTGKNANVFYETGIAHSLGKDVVMVVQNADDVPFDLRHLRYISYLNNNEGVAKLAEQVVGRVQALAPLP